jgi:hypothetical protein
MLNRRNSSCSHARPRLVRAAADHRGGTSGRVDAGLATGLRDNARRRTAGRVHHGIFVADHFARQFVDGGTSASTRPVYDRTIADVASFVTVHEATSPRFHGPSRRRRILFIDVAKSWETTTSSSRSSPSQASPR